jgi:hypothetical protein
MDMAEIQPERKTPPALALDPEFFGALFSIEVPKAKLNVETRDCQT